MIIALFLYGLIPLIQALVFIRIQTQFGIWGGAGDLVNLLSSVFAYHWLQANLILGAKIPLFQKVFPYDKRIRFHIMGSAGIVGAVLYHGLYKTLMGYHIGPLTLFLGLSLALLLVLSVLWIPLPGFKRVRRAVTNRFKPKDGQEASYDRYKIFHSLLAFSLSGIILIHVFASGSFALLPFPSRLGYALLFILSAGLIILSKTARFAEKNTVEEIEVREGILTLTLKGRNRPMHKAGQFAFLGIPGSGSILEEHPFSYLNDGEEGKSRFAIRLVGPFTEKLSRLKRGDSLTLRGGFGNFRPSGDKPVCLIGSGIGIVPLISLLDEWRRKGEKRRGEVFFSVNAREEIPRYGELMEMVEQNGNIGLHLLVNGENPRRFDEDYFRERLEDPGKYRYYICSSPGVRTAILAILKSLRIKKNRIHYEAFSFG